MMSGSKMRLIAFNPLLIVDTAAFLNNAGAGLRRCYTLLISPTVPVLRNLTPTVQRQIGLQVQCRHPLNVCPFSFLQLRFIKGPKSSYSSPQ
jgi:hypothetical protein